MLKWTAKDGNHIWSGAREGVTVAVLVIPFMGYLPFVYSSVTKTGIPFNRSFQILSVAKRVAIAAHKTQQNQGDLYERRNSN